MVRLVYGCVSLQTVCISKNTFNLIRYNPNWGQLVSSWLFQPEHPQLCKLINSEDLRTPGRTLLFVTSFWNINSLIPSEIKSTWINTAGMISRDKKREVKHYNAPEGANRIERTAVWNDVYKKSCTRDWADNQDPAADTHRRADECEECYWSRTPAVWTRQHHPSIGQADGSSEGRSYSEETLNTSECQGSGFL